MKRLDHPHDRLRERTLIAPKELDALIERVKGMQLTAGKTYHYEWPDRGYAVIAPTRKGSDIHVVKTVLAPRMKPPGEKVASPHIFVTGHSGAGKTTKARELSQQTGLPIFSVDDAPEIRELHQRQKEEARRTGTFVPDAKAEHTALSGVMRRVSALKQPHIVEGTHFLAAPQLIPTGASVVIVDRPKEQILRQRVEREGKKREQAGRTPDPKGTRARGEILHRHYAPGLSELSANVVSGQKVAGMYRAFFDELFCIFGGPC